MSRKCILIAIFTLSLCFCNNASADDPNIIAQCTGTPATNYGTATRFPIYAQGFVAEKTGKVHEVQLKMQRRVQGETSYGGFLRLTLHKDDNGDPGDSSYGEGTLYDWEIPVTDFNVPGEPNWISFKVPSRPIVEEDSKWWIVLEYVDPDPNTIIDMAACEAPPDDDFRWWVDGRLKLWEMATKYNLNFRVFTEPIIRDTNTTLVVPDTVEPNTTSLIMVDVVDSENEPAAGEVTLSADYGIFPATGTSEVTLDLTDGNAVAYWKAPDSEKTFPMTAVYSGCELCGGVHYNYSDDTNTISVEIFSDARPTSTILHLSSASIDCSTSEQPSLITVTADVTDDYNLPVTVDEGYVTFTCGSGKGEGKFEDKDVWVSDGNASTTWTAPTKGGTYEINADYSGWKFGTPKFHASKAPPNDVQVNYVDVNTSLVVRVNPDVAYIGKKALVIARVETTTGYPVRSGNVEFSALHGDFDPNQIRVSNGLAWTHWTAPDYTCEGFVSAEYPVYEDPTTGYRYGESSHLWGYTVQEDSDPLGPELSWFSQWISDYDDNPLRWAQDQSQGFTDKLSSVWDCADDSLEFNNGDAYAAYMKKALFWGQEDLYLDSHDFTWYNGHGHPDYITFITSDHYLKHSQASGAWGDRDAEWVALKCCKVLSHASDWAKTMDGLHLICGFHTKAISSPRFGKLFAEFMIKDGLCDEAHTIPQAWFLAGDETQDNDRKQRVIGETPLMFCDYLWGQGKVQPDPQVNNSDCRMDHDFGSPNAPDANAGGPYTGVISQPIQLDGSGSSDPDHEDYLFYAWDVNLNANTDNGDWDLTGVNTAWDDADAWGRHPKVVFNKVGTFPIRLMVIDDTWRVDVVGTDVNVTPAPPSSSIFQEQTAQTQSNGGIEIVDNFDPNDLPTWDYMPLFRFEESNIGYLDMTNIAQYWGMTADSAELDELDNWNMVEDNYELMVNRYTGSVMYVNREKAYIFPEDVNDIISGIKPEPCLPDPCSARCLVEDFFDDSSIVIDADETVFENITDIFAGSAIKGSRTVESRFPFQRRVNYRRQLHLWGSRYHPVVGPGGKITAMIDDSNDVILFVKVWREVVKADEVEDVTLHPAASAVADFHSLGPKALVKGSHIPLCNRIEIDNVSLGYYEDDFVTPQKEFLPVYILDLTCEDDKGSQHVQVYMSAIAPEISTASDLCPVDGAMNVAPCFTTLIWGSGKYAYSHDVYLGTNFDDVNDASGTNPLGVLVSENQEYNCYVAENLKPNTTYYWRIDEIGFGGLFTWQGSVWSFTTTTRYIPEFLLKVDIDASGCAGPNDTHPGWTSWEMPALGPFGPVMKNFGYNPTNCDESLPIVELDGFTAGSGGGCWSANSLSVDVNNPADFARMYKDHAFVPHTPGIGMGLDYIKVDFLFGPDCAGKEFEFTFWSWDPNIAGSGIPGFPGSGEPPKSKFVAWSTTNPREWLINWGYQNGYYPTGTDSNMPAGLKALVNTNGGIALQHGTAPWLLECDVAHGMNCYSASMVGRLDEYGRITYYGWADMTTMIGSTDACLNGFAIGVPKPDTADLTGDGVVDYQDLKIMTDEWLDTGYCEADLYKDCKVDFKDFAILADSWLGEEL